MNTALKIAIIAFLVLAACHFFANEIEIALLVMFVGADSFIKPLVVIIGGGWLVLWLMGKLFNTTNGPLAGGELHRWAIRVNHWSDARRLGKRIR